MFVSLRRTVAWFRPGRKPFAHGDIPDVPYAAPADDAVGRGRDAVRGLFVRRSAAVLVLWLAVLLGGPEAAHAAVPGAPTDLSATLTTSTQASLSWTAPTNNGPAITGYQIEHSAWDARYMDWGTWEVAAVADTGPTSTTYSYTYSSTLAPGVKLRYRVSAINADGTGGPSNVPEATVLNAPDTAGNGAPDPTGVTINGDRFVITFDEALDGTQIPQNTPLFEVLINRGRNPSPRVLQNMEVAGSTVVGMLHEIDAVDSNDVVHIGYRPPTLKIGNGLVVISDNALQDSEGNLVANWSAAHGAATNDTLAPVRSYAPPPAPPAPLAPPPPPAPLAPPPLAPDAPEVTQTERGRTPGLVSQARGGTTDTSGPALRPEGSPMSLDATWTEPDNMHCPGGCPEITHYDLQYRRGGSGDWIDGLQEVTGTETTISVPDLMSPYQVRVRAVNAEGTEGPWSEPGVWSPPLEMASSRLMRAWLSRFGRTVADQVMDAVGARLQEPVGSPPGAGLQASIAGRSLGEAQGGTGVTGARVMDAADIEPEIHTRSLSGLDLLRSSSFSYSDGDPGAGMMSVWGRGAVTGFDGRDEYDSGTVDVDGTVRSLMLGTDVRRASGVFGAVLTHSHGKGDYRDGPEEEGRIRSTLTGVYPYASHETGGLSLWGIMGYGKGEVTMHHDVSPYRMGTLVTTDMDLQMAAGGLRSELPGSTPDGVSVNAVADVMGVRAESDGVGKMLSAADTKVARMRAGLESAWDAVEVGGGRMTPVARISFRHDGGDAEGGFGVDIEGRLHWSDPAQGVRMQLRGHGLLGHEADEFRERGISGSVSWDPVPESLRGAAFSLTSSVSEATTADVDYLLRNPGDHGVAARLSEDDDPERDNRNSHQRMQAKVGYGIGIFEGRFTGIPELGVGWTDESRIYNLGWRLLKEGSNAGAFEILLEASHREDTDDGESRDRIGLRLKARF